MPRLTSLRLDAIRGATRPFELKFDPNKPLVVIYGENGTGKTTLCDALDLLANESLSSLDGKGLGAATRYWTSTNRQSTELQIKLGTASGVCTAQLSKSKLVITPITNRPKVSILRRHQILNLIAATPSARYAALRQFIAIDGIDRSEAALRELIKGLEKERETAEAKTCENLASLENLWHQAGSPPPTMLAWAESEAKQATADLEQAISVLRNCRDLCSAFVSRSKDLQQARTREESARTALAKAQSALDAELRTATAGSQQLAGLLQAASTFFHQHGAKDACPLCGSREAAAGLPQALDAKLNGLAALRNALTLKEQAQKQAEQAISLLESARNHAASVAEQLRVACTKAWRSDFPAPPAILTSEAEADLFNRLAEVAAQFSAELEPEATRRAQRRALLQTVRDALNQYHHNRQRRSEIEKLLPRAQQAHQILVEERRAFVDDLLKRIADRVGVLYEKIHPGEGLNKINLQLDPDKRASLEVFSQFPGAKESPPPAFLSESHLDTLGICIFIALAELDSPVTTLLVLDDVLSGSDESHLNRFLDMLASVSTRFAHCLLTTHYRPWRDQFRSGSLKSDSCQFIELGPWSLASGLTTVAITAFTPTTPPPAQTAAPMRKPVETRPARQQTLI